MTGCRAVVRDTRHSSLLAWYASIGKVMALGIVAGLRIRMAVSARTRLLRSALGSIQDPEAVDLGPILGMCWQFLMGDASDASPTFIPSR